MIRKWLLTVAACGVLAVSFVGCGEEAAPAKKTTTATTATKPAKTTSATTAMKAAPKTEAPTKKAPE